MVRPVATINRKDIYSDKQMTGIVNTKVIFEDGSWCDVATGEVVNNGVGYINIGTPTVGGDTEKMTHGPYAFSTQILDISNIKADVEVSVIDGDQMIVTIEGPSSEVKDINVNQSSNTLAIQGKGGNSGIRGANVVISGSTVASLSTPVTSASDVDKSTSSMVVAKTRPSYLSAYPRVPLFAFVVYRVRQSLVTLRVRFMQASLVAKTLEPGKSGTQLFPFKVPATSTSAR